MTRRNGATPEGTKRYAARFHSTLSPEHFRVQQRLYTSTIGLGTYLGHWDERTDRMYQQSVSKAIELGCNVIDSAISYRFQRSERAIGAALKQLFDSGKASRDEIIVATKGGFFPFDNEPPRDPRAWLQENIINSGVARTEDFVDSHCMSPGYLDNQLDRSLQNLGLDTIDIYYIHNPETQLECVSREEFLRRMRVSFEFLESAVRDGRINMYGTATWNGYRQSPDSRDYLSLESLVEIARAAGGEDHHFRVIQLPFNLGMPEAVTSPNQSVGGETLNLFEAASQLALTVMCSATILQARLAQNLPGFVGSALTGLSTDAQRAIQFVRSTPGVTTSLVGMSQRSHVEENLMVARIPPAPLAAWLKMFSEQE